MPTIQLRGDNRDALRIEAIMNYPDEDEDFREKMVSLVAVKIGEHISRYDRDALLESQPFFVVDENIQKTTRDGYLAGWMLATLYVKHSMGYEKLSLTKVVSDGIAWAKKQGTFADGSPIPCGKTKWFETKTRFEPVAHLWAVLILNSELKICDSNRQLFTEPYLTQFMGVAAELLQFGTTYISTQASKPFLSLDVVYEIPEHFAHIAPQIDNSVEKVKKRVK